MEGLSQKDSIISRVLLCTVEGFSAKLFFADLSILIFVYEKLNYRNFQDVFTPQSYLKRTILFRRYKQSELLTKFYIFIHNYINDYTILLP